MMVDIYLELAGKKAVAWSLEWPGWCRIRASEAEVLRAMSDTAPRYEVIAGRAGLSFKLGNLSDLVVAGRLVGDGMTAWGVPSVLAPADTQPIAAPAARRQMALLRAAWDLLEEGVAASPEHLRKGPRGGGRDRDKLRRHVIEAERTYARKIGVRHPPFDADDQSALNAMRDAIAAVLAQPSSGEPLIEGGWNASYAVRRMAWHVVDHLWELEDRRE